MGFMVVTRVVEGPQTQAQAKVIQRRLQSGTRDVKPVVDYFAKALRESINFDFRVGGREPFVWAPNTRNVIAAKGHGTPLKGKHGWKLRDSIKIEVGGQPRRWETQVKVPQIGAYHMEGWKGMPGGRLYAKPGRVLVFEAAEDQSDFILRRRKAVEKRRAGNRHVRIPSRPGKVLVFAKSVKSVGYPARRFVVVREGLIREAWRKPLRAFLFQGVMPR